mmetsp:Transcript_64600/g.123268  ORF Transcript_64600/g.123268 Transcript_64600/m.123268 type:complete len:293 (-) Transcript_64600:175-1053(-)
MGGNIRPNASQLGGMTNMSSSPLSCLINPKLPLSFSIEPANKAPPVSFADDAGTSSGAGEVNRGSLGNTVTSCLNQQFAYLHAPSAKNLQGTEDLGSSTALPACVSAFPSATNISSICFQSSSTPPAAMSCSRIRGSSAGTVTGCCCGAVFGVAMTCFCGAGFGVAISGFCQIGAIAGRGAGRIGRGPITTGCRAGGGRIGGAIVCGCDASCCFCTSLSGTKEVDCLNLGITDLAASGITDLAASSTGSAVGGGTTIGGVPCGVCTAFSCFLNSSSISCSAPVMPAAVCCAP